VAAFVTGHIAHAASRQWLERALTGQIQGIVGAGTLADVYERLTGLETLPRLRARQALHLIEENLRDFEVVVLRPAEHRRALARAADLGWSSARRALVAEAALRVGADVLLSIDPDALVPLGADVAGIVRNPEAT
jgi:predicted nucleic acid-binding protein